VAGDVRTETTGAVAVVTVDYPPVNALSDDVLEGLRDGALRFASDENVRAIVLTGAGDKSFLAGADLQEFRAALGQEEWIRRHTGLTRETLTRWESLPQPVVGAIQASAVGGGLEVALVCDLLVADPAARFGFPEVRLGLMPGAGGTQRLPRRVGIGRAREMVMLGSTIDAEEARRIGLVTSISPPRAALDSAKELAARLASLPGIAVKGIKHAIALAGTVDIEAGLDEERELFMRTFSSQDVHEGIAAFLEKRAPRFEHR
jgi:enoyl-CoA hydratase/carnithine racemase